MDELLVKYMVGEATPAEMEMVAQWVKESEYNEKYFAHFKLIWETSRSLNIESKLDVDASWAEFKQLTENAEKSHKETATGIPLTNRNTDQRVTVIRPLNGYKQWMKIAAIWVSVVGLAGLFYTFLHPGQSELLTLQTFDTVKTYTLADGSVITLNKNSTVTYPKEFTGNTREIKLNSGEAFFSIAHNRAKPFLVHINDAVVKVVGTSFNIRNNEERAEVIVETGIVEVIRKKVIIRLKAAEKVDIDYKSGKMLKGLTRDNFYNYYRTKEFVADNIPLWRIVEVLNSVYKVNIEVPDTLLANRRLTTRLKLGALDPILEIIAITLKADVVHESGKIIIK